MTRNPSCHLVDMLAEVPDPRNKKGKRYLKCHRLFRPKNSKVKTSFCVEIP